MSNMNDVYGSDDSNELFSLCVTRAFGVNKMVKMDCCYVLAAVMPLCCDPEKAGLKVVGVIEE